MKRSVTLTLMTTALLAPLLSSAQAAGATGPSEWRTWNNKSYRLEADGNLSCFSTDGVSCYGAPRPATVEVERPLVCGAAHRDKYGSTGYDQPGHWCNEAYAQLFATWTHYGSLGVQTLLAFSPTGDPMCLSYDGQSCQWGVAATAQPDFDRLKPLVCGPIHRAIYGVTGYEQPGHWCNTPEIVARYTSPLAAAGAARSVTLSMPAWTRADEPAWIVRTSLPRNTLLEFGFTAKTSEQGASLFDLQQLDDTRVRLLRASSPVDVSMPHPNGGATFAIQVRADGRVGYQAAAGLVTDILSPTRQIALSPEPPLDGSALAASRPALQNYESDKTLKLFLSPNGTATPTGEVLEVLAVRQRSH